MTYGIDYVMYIYIFENSVCTGYVFLILNTSIMHGLCPRLYTIYIHGNSMFVECVYLILASFMANGVFVTRLYTDMKI